MAKQHKAGVKTGFDVTDGSAIDKRLDAWANRGEALKGILGLQRNKALLYPVEVNGIVVWHRFLGGTADINFVPFDPRFNLADALIYAGVSFNTDQDEVTLTDTQWRISDILHTLPDPVTYPIPTPDATGLLRIDNIIGDYNGQLTYQTGVADENAIAPTVPYKNILVTTIYVTLETTVEDPADVENPDVRLREGVGDPSNTLGVAGDSYLNTANGEVWFKTLIVDEVATWDKKYTPVSGASSFADLTGDPYDNTNLATALDTLNDDIITAQAAADVAQDDIDYVESTLLPAKVSILADPFTDVINPFDKVYIERSGVPKRLFLDEIADFVTAYGFLPTQRAGLTIWSDASDMTKVTRPVAGKASVFIDKSTNARNLTAPLTANRADYYTSGGANNLPYAHFASGQYLELTGLALTMPYTLYLMVKQDSFVNNSVMVMFGSDYTNGIVQQTYGPTAVAGSSWRPIVRNFYNNKWSLLTFKITSAGMHEVSIDKEPYISDGSTIGTAGISRIRIGTSTAFSFHEMVMYSDVVSVEDDNKIRTYFMTKYQPSLNQFLFAFGDSITAGVGATTNDNQYVSQVCLSKGINKYNYGIASTTVDSAFGTGTVGSNLIDLYNKKNVARRGYITFCYGTNDVIDAPGTGWKASYKAIVQYFVDRGFDKNKICVVTPPYQSIKLAKLTLCRTLCQEIATELGVRFADCFTDTMNNGGDALLTDGTHPNNAGHLRMANVIIAALA